jgi:hypothetical protein
MKWLKVRLSKAKEWIAEKRKVALIATGVVVICIVLGYLVWKVPGWMMRAYHGKLDASAISRLTPQELIQLQKDLITAENNARATLAQILGGLALLFGLYLTYRNVKVAHKNVEVAEQGKLTERFSKAVELLGSEKIEVRLGGIYALERIARDSQKDHWTVMEVLTAFVREQSKNEYEEIADSEGNITRVAVESKPNITADIQAALTVIGRRKWTDQERPRQKIDLTDSFLRGTVLFEANLRNANLCNTILTRSLLIRTDLRNAILFNANLIEADLNYAKLDDALLDYAKLQGADLSKSIGLTTWEQISQAIIDEKTKLPPKVEEQRRAEQQTKAVGTHANE